MIDYWQREFEEAVAPVVGLLARWSARLGDASKAANLISTCFVLHGITGLRGVGLKRDEAEVLVRRSIDQIFGERGSDATTNGNGTSED